MPNWDPEVARFALDTWVLPITAGIVLASAAGLRAFLPLAAVAWAVHFGWLDVASSFAWIGSVPAVLLFTAAVVFEVAGDKFPAVDHLLDGIQTFLKPVAGALVVAAPLVELDPLYALVLGLVTGGALAGGIHFLKAKGRIIGNLLTLGVAAPVLSVLEDVVTVALVLLAIALPVVALGAVLLLGVFLFAVVRRRRPVPERA